MNLRTYKPSNLWAVTLLNVSFVFWFQSQRLDHYWQHIETLLQVGDIDLAFLTSVIRHSSFLIRALPSILRPRCFPFSKLYFLNFLTMCPANLIRLYYFTNQTSLKYIFLDLFIFFTRISLHHLYSDTLI